MKKTKERKEFLGLLHQWYMHTLDTWGEMWIANLRHNAPQMKHTIREFRTGKQETCLIFAPGASLTQYEQRIKELRDNRNFYIVGTPTPLKWMMAHGLSPDCLVVADSQPAQYNLIKDSRWRGQILAPITTTPQIGREYDPVYWFNVKHSKPGFTPIQDMVSETQYPELPRFPSVSCVTNVALQLMMHATRMGRTAFKRYVLVGTDYGYWRGMPRVPNGLHTAEIPQNDLIEIDGRQTNYNMAFYKERLYMLLLGNPEAMVYTLSDGILTELRHLSYQQLRMETYPPQLPLAQLQEAYRKYLLETMPGVLIPAMKIKRPAFRELVKQWLSGGELHGRQESEERDDGGAAGDNGAGDPAGSAVPLDADT